MQLTYLVALCCLITAVRAVTDKEHRYAVAYLKKYGYLPESHDGGEDQKLINAMMEFQNFAGMEMNGRMDDDMMRMMEMPRCGVTDKHPTTDGARRKRYNIFGTQWKQKHLTFKIEQYSTKIPRNKLDSTIQKSFDIWTKYTDLTFTQTTDDSANFKVTFAGGYHGDRSSFDGSGGDLAHAYSPRSGEIHFDEEEQWVTEGGSRGTFNLYQVAAHEVGHALGLAHSDITAALMTPFYEGYHSEFQTNLHQDDIDGIQAIYGERQEMAPPRGATQFACDGGAIGGLALYEGKLYVFKGNHFVSFGGERLEVERMSTRWLEVPDNSKVFVFRNKIYFLKGGLYWKYVGDRLEAGYPKIVGIGFPGVPVEPDAVMPWRNKLVFFKGSLYWIFDPLKTPRVMSTYPKNINEWGFPNKLDIALHHPSSRSVFVFKNDKFYIYNDVTGSMSGPKSIRKDFFECP